MKVLHADAAAAGMRLDQWLAGLLAPDFSRSRVQALIRDGQVEIGGKPADEPKKKLAGGETVIVALPEPEPAEPGGEAIPLAVLYEDASLIVVDKPAGLVVHPGAGNWTGTLVNALIHHCGDSLSGIGGVRRPGIVHRLDKETSGVGLGNHHDAAHRALSEAFADHGASGGLERAYVALVWGAPARTSGTIDAPLGRTHQIRVHMAHLGHPVVGDPDYGQAFRTKANRLPEPLRAQVKASPRQALHARLLGFDHPASGEHMRFEADLPADMAALVEGLRAL